MGADAKAPDTPQPSGAKPTPAAAVDRPKPAAKAEVDDSALRAPVPSRCLERLSEVFPDTTEATRFHCGVPIARIPRERILEVSRFLKDDPSCRMTLLSDLCGVDRSAGEDPNPRFEVVYHLYSVETRERITLKVAVGEDEEVPSVTSVWRTANWHEREAFDMFGIHFSGHPDLRRILMPEGFDAHPLRKDFPLEGRETDHGTWRQPEDDRRQGRLS